MAFCYYEVNEIETELLLENIQFADGADVRENVSREILINALSYLFMEHGTLIN